MARRARRASGRGKMKRPVGWVRTFFQGQTVDESPLIEFDLVNGDDWSIGTTMNERATLRRIRGSVSFAPPLTADVTFGIFAAIYKSDIDAAAVTPTSSAIVLEDLLALWTVQVPGRPGAAVEERAMHRWDIDIKAMRVMANDSVIQLVLRTDVAPGAVVTFSGHVDCLVSRGSSS